MRKIKKLLFRSLSWVLALYRSRSKFRYLENLKNGPAHVYLQENHAPELSRNEIMAVDDYWGQFGIKIRDYCWFRHFKHVTGVFSPRYIPNDIYAAIIALRYNATRSESYWIAWKDKNYFERFVPGIPFPKVALRRIHGRYLRSSGEVLPDVDQAARCVLDFVNNNSESHVIVKDAISSGEGRGVRKYDISSVEDAKAMLAEWSSDNFLVQVCVRQHPFFARFNPDSVNVMRLTTWRHEDKVELLAPTLRFGIKGSVTDVTYVNGVETVNLVGIDADGRVKDFAYTADGQCKPISSIIGKDGSLIVPRWQNIVSMVKRAHLLLDHFDIVGWDVIVDEKDQIVVIEYNIKRPGTVFYQYCHGPFWGSHTDEMLAFLREPQNRDRCIPKQFRCK